MTRHLVDTTVFIHARGASHPHREPCRVALQAVIDGDSSLSERRAAARTRPSSLAPQHEPQRCSGRGGRRPPLLPPLRRQREVCDRASALLERYDHLGVRDAVHAATALEAGFTSILSTDPAFDRIDEIDKVDPTSLTS
jgi:uncharacterized protein